MGTMSKIFTDIFLFTLLFQAMLYLLASYGVGVNIGGIPDLSVWQNWFSINALSGTIFAVGGTITVISLLFKQSSYPIYALVITMASAFITPVQNTLTMLPNILCGPNGTGGIIPAEATPYPIWLVLTTINVVASGWFIASLLMQRPIE